MDRTVLKKPQPLYAIGATVYSRASAARGFFEPLLIAAVQFDPARRTYVYSWERNLGPAARHALSPVRLYESELVTVAEAASIQLGVLKRQQTELQAQVDKFCTEAITTKPRIVLEVNGKTQPPAPLFGDNEIVYLRESAEVVGRLEAYRITAVAWRNDIKQWSYGMHIRRRPGRNMTVGDRIDLTHEFDLTFPESELCSLCEALPLALSYMNKAVTQAQFRLDAYSH